MASATVASPDKTNFRRIAFLLWPVRHQWDSLGTSPSVGKKLSQPDLGSQGRARTALPLACSAWNKTTSQRTEAH